MYLPCIAKGVVLIHGTQLSRNTTKVPAIQIVLLYRKPRKSKQSHAAVLQ